MNLCLFSAHPELSLISLKLLDAACTQAFLPRRAPSSLLLFFTSQKIFLISYLSSAITKGPLN